MDIRIICVVSLFLMIPACESANQNGMVSGTVKLDNELVPRGAVEFFPVDGKSPTAAGIIENGKYTAEVPVGVHNVKIIGEKVIGKRKAYPTPDSPLIDVTAELVPAKFNRNSQLKEQIKSGPQEVNFDLKSK